jgi:hypothetical protein
MLTFNLALPGCMQVHSFPYPRLLFVSIGVSLLAVVPLAMSRVFFEYPTDLASKSKGSILATAFSNADQQIMAAATKNGDITMYLEEVSGQTDEERTTVEACEIVVAHSTFSVVCCLEGEHMDPEQVLHRSGECCHLHWHPKLNLLASGWDDGTLGVWSEKERVFREESATHKAPITLLTFSPEGSRLISGDSNGLLVVWNVDHRGRLQQVAASLISCSARRPA